MAADQTYSVTRTRATWKPRVNEIDVPFFRCTTCNHIFMGISAGEMPHLSGDGRAPMNEPPYQTMHKPPQCCGSTMELLEYVELVDLPDSIHFDYEIVGGFNNNALSVSWDISSDSSTLEWIALKTFSGMQMKYLYPKKKSPMLFAFAEEDAYAYCDESPCLECVFMCKRGFVVYAYLTDVGLVRMPLTRMSPYWESHP